MARNPFGIVPKEILNLNLTPVQIALFTVLTTYANANRIARPSQKTLGLHLQMTERAVRNNLRVLEQVGAITTIPIFNENGGQKANHYRLDLLLSSGREEPTYRDREEPVFRGEEEPTFRQTVPDRTVQEEQYLFSPISEKSASPPPSENSLKSVYDDAAIRAWKTWEPYKRGKGSRAMFMAEWDKRVWRNGKNPLDPEMVIRCIVTFCRRKAREDTLTMDACRWIRNQLWRDELEMENEPATPNRYESPYEREKRQRIERYYASGYWMAEWGDPPPMPQSRPGSAVRSAARQGTKE